MFDEVFKTKTSGDLLCPVCGQRLSKILLTGLAGCPECFEIFKEHITGYMKQHGIYGTYTGQMPERLSSFRSVLTDRMEIQKKLDLAVQNEDYEKAAFYRDYLHAIENTAVSDGEK